MEFIIITAVGLGIGLAANAMHRDGIKLSRDDYFNKAVLPRPSQNGPTTTRSTDTNTSDPDGQSSNNNETRPTESEPEDPVVKYLKELGYQVMTHEEAVETYNDPFYRDEIFIFVDARRDDLYLEGHVPGAHQLDQFHLERYIDTVREAAELAEKVVIYCEGGECEDSLYAMRTLLDENIPLHKLYIYAGGLTEWQDNDMPVERGERLSGDIIDGVSEIEEATP
jgi:rhodanese-related sulfurtransferase